MVCRIKKQNMTSRKRNKGKGRKAKKAELEAERVESERTKVRVVWQEFALGLDGCGRVVTPCNHCALAIPDDKNHPVSCFIDTFFLNTIRTKFPTIGSNLSDTFQKHREVWDNTSYRKMAVNIMISIGTNYMFGKEFFCGPGELARSNDIARVIVVLENYDGREDLDSTVCSRIVSTKWRDLCYTGTCMKRDLVKFYRKRTACSCLKKVHLETRKTLPKVGNCTHCKEVKERALLMVCSRCRIAQYCSRECQNAHWSRHKGYCEYCVSVHKEHVMGTGIFHNNMDRST